MTIASGFRHFLEKLNKIEHTTSKQTINVFRTKKVILDVYKRGRLSNWQYKYVTQLKSCLLWQENDNRNDKLSLWHMLVKRKTLLVFYVYLWLTGIIYHKYMSFLLFVIVNLDKKNMIDLCPVSIHPVLCDQKLSIKIITFHWKWNWGRVCLRVWHFSDKKPISKRP